MSKIVSTLRISAIFLATILVAGTIALSYPSFMIGAQAQQYYGMNNYEDRKSYGMDSYDSQYPPSYKPDYKPKYPSYDGKDNRDKSKDSSKSITINKLKCINTNLNINGENAGDINLGNKNQGYLGTYSSSGSGYDGNERYYYDGYNNNKKDNGFDCIINNNNNNTNVVAGGGGNVTDGNELPTCEECFSLFLNSTNFQKLEVALANGLEIEIGGGQTVILNSFEEICFLLENITGVPLSTIVSQILTNSGLVIPNPEAFELITCIGTALGITIPPFET